MIGGESTSRRWISRRARRIMAASVIRCAWLAIPFASAGMLFLMARTFHSRSPHPANRKPSLFRGMYDPELSPSTHNLSFQYWAPDLQPPILRAAASAPQWPAYSKSVETSLRWSYLADEKHLPYVGNTDDFQPNTRHYLNALATFPGATTEPGPDGIWRMHGLLGVDGAGHRLWQQGPSPPPISEVPGGADVALKNGGFYLNLSDALPLDRAVPDFREEVCKQISFDVSKLPDASVVITFYNEPLSTLLRSVHSVLNQTPPSLLREIILVDDHSNLTQNLPGSPLYNYITYLPKLRLGERRGLVHARLAGARMATGEVLVILDSHIEVNAGWLEPQLDRIRQNRNSIVFPQILAINPETFEYDAKSGIGCKVSFKWSMVEQSSLTGKVTDPKPVPSPSMAGGLFAVDLDYFWHLGGYDEGFSMWGAENVEMGFRTWLCGGRLECLPCAKTFHIYRKKGHGYESPHESIVRNKMRAARVWTDEYYAVSKLFLGGKDEIDIGSLDKMLALKHQLKCRPFKWFLDTIDPGHDIQSTSSITHHGELRSKHPTYIRMCLDTMSKNNAGEAFGLFHCHGEGGTQHWIKLREKHTIIPVSNERLCLSSTLKFQPCNEVDSNTTKWELVKIYDNVVQIHALGNNQCLAIRMDLLSTKDNSPPIQVTHPQLEMKACRIDDTLQHFTFDEYVPAEVAPLTFSDEWIARQLQYAGGA